MKIYKIKDWTIHFENSKSRERERCSFCCIPNKQDGLGYGMLMREKDGPALYGAFIAVVLVCSKQKNREGWITQNGLPADCPLTARQLSIKCQIPESTIQSMLDAVTGGEIGWIEVYEEIDGKITQKHQQNIKSARRVPAECPPSALEEKGREVEGKRKEMDRGFEPSPEQIRLGKFFKRRPTTKWSAKELAALKQVTPIDPADFDTLEKYYLHQHAPDKDYRRRDLITLLNNFNAEVDRARRFKVPNCL